MAQSDPLEVRFLVLTAILATTLFAPVGLGLPANAEGQQPAPQTQPAMNPEQKPESFSDGDILKITAYGREDLTALYSVQPGPLLSLPLIGIVSLKNRSLRQLETEIAKEWENRLGAPMSITIEFTQRAPFYVLGAVTSPGAYPYRNGMTVLQAIAASGGMEKLIANDARLRLDVLREKERRDQAADVLAEALATRARVIAERDGEEELQNTVASMPVAKERMDALFTEQAVLLDKRLKQNNLKERLLSDQIRLGEAEIASYMDQYNTMLQQQKQVEKEATRLRRVPGQQVRVFELDQRSTTLETTKASVMASVSRAKIGVEAARNGIAAQRESRLQELTETLAESERQIIESTLSFETADQFLQNVQYSESQAIPEFRLLRQGGRELEPVISTSEIRPGDLLEVTIVESSALPKITKR